MEKRKVAVAAVSLILCLAVLISSSYAWISISRSPEISGVTTNIGSNGSLEIALLTKETFENPSLIRSKIGDSSVIQEKTVSNLSWGNVIDLTDESYGLDKISLLPSRLNVFSGEDEKKTVSGNILGFVDYGSDGRIEHQNLETVSAVYSEEGFVFNSENQSHGVRGIGTISNISPQQTALTSARSFVSSYRNNALAETKAALTTNGNGIIDIYERRYTRGESLFTVQDVRLLQDTAIKMKKALDYIDLALRQGIIGYASSMIDDAETFRTLRVAVENTSIPLSMLVSSLPSELPSGFSDWITKTDEKRFELQKTITVCNYINKPCSWEQISEILDVLIDADKIFIGKYKLSSSAAFENMVQDNVLTLKEYNSINPIKIAHSIITDIFEKGYSKIYGSIVEGISYHYDEFGNEWEEEVLVEPVQFIRQNDYSKEIESLLSDEGMPFDQVMIDQVNSLYEPIYSQLRIIYQSSLNLTINDEKYSNPLPVINLDMAPEEYIALNYDFFESYNNNEIIKKKYELQEEIVYTSQAIIQSLKEIVSNIVKVYEVEDV